VADGRGGGKGRDGCRAFEVRRKMEMETMISEVVYVCMTQPNLLGINIPVHFSPFNILIEKGNATTHL
jgi:hypothetical protein